MGLFDTIKTRVKKGTDTVLDTTAKVGNYMEEKSATLVEKVPGGHDLKEKAAKYTEKAVDRVGHETKEMINEGHEFIESHMKKDEKGTTPATPVSPTPTVEVKPDAKVEIPAPVVAPEITTPVTEPIAEKVIEEKKEETEEPAEKHTTHTHKKVAEKKTHTTKKAHPHTKK